MCVTMQRQARRCCVRPQGDLSQSHLEQIIEGRSDFWRQCHAPNRRFRLQSKQNDFARPTSQQAQSTQQVAEPEQVHALAGRNRPKIPICEPEQGTRRCAELHGIDGQQMREPFHARQQVKSHRSAFDDLNPRRDPAALGQSADCVHAQTVIGAQQIAKAKYGNLGARLQIHLLPRVVGQRLQPAALSRAGSGGQISSR